MGDDIAALIEHLGLERVDLVGYSLGGGVAFQTAVNHPELVRKLVIVSANVRRSAIYADMLDQQGQVSAAAADNLKGTPMYESYMRLAPRPEDFPRLLDKMGASMAQDFDFSDEVRGIQVPMLFVAADADMFPPSHAVEVFALLDGGQRDGGWMGEGRPKGGHALAILPGVQHYNILTSPVFAADGARLPRRARGVAGTGPVRSAPHADRTVPHGRSMRLLGALAFAVVCLVVIAGRPGALRAADPVAPAPELSAFDAPFTRNDQVSIAFVVPPEGGPVAQFRASNDATTSGGVLSNGVSVPAERRVDAGVRTRRAANRLRTGQVRVRAVVARREPRAHPGPNPVELGRGRHRQCRHHRSIRARELRLACAHGDPGGSGVWPGQRPRSFNRRRR